MPIPTPKKDEEKNKFTKRCIEFVREEGKSAEEAIAICLSKWEESQKDKKN